MSIGSNKVTLDKIQQINTQSFLGRNTALSGNVEILTSTQAKSILGLTNAVIMDSTQTLTNKTYNGMSVLSNASGITLSSSNTTALLPITSLGTVAYRGLSISNKAIQVEPLITARIPLNEYQSIYNNLSDNKAIASILVYPAMESAINRAIELFSNKCEIGNGIVGIIGAGNFTSAMILPCLKKTPAFLKYISSSSGLTGTTLAKKYKIANSTTDNSIILEDKEVELIMITTRHNSHAKFVIDALMCGKNVFVEKPLALHEEELEKVIESYKRSGKSLTVGFNRRFAPFAIQMKNILGSADTPMNIIATINAGFIPSNIWVHDLEIGGGRIIGEACHFIDLITFLTGSKVKSVCMNSMGIHVHKNTDNASILLKYENGTNGVINYFSNGSKAYAKERIEVYHQERTLVMDNWKKLQGYGFKNFKSASSSQDKGHQNQFNLLIKSVQQGGTQIIPFDDLVNTTRASFAAIESLKNDDWVSI
jgi:predicted dehydrogenase